MSPAEPADIPPRQRPAATATSGEQGPTSTPGRVDSRPGAAIGNTGPTTPASLEDTGLLGGNHD
jgi:hypothetical protein